MLLKIRVYFFPQVHRFSRIFSLTWSMSPIKNPVVSLSLFFFFWQEYFIDIVYCHQELHKVCLFLCCVRSYWGLWPRFLTLLGVVSHSISVILLLIMIHVFLHRKALSSDHCPEVSFVQEGQGNCLCVSFQNNGLLVP